MSKAPGVLKVVGLQGQPAREFKVGYLPHEAAAAHPCGAGLRVCVDGTILRTQAFRETDAVEREAHAWI